VYDHFGSAPYFTFFDTDKDSYEVMDNSNQHHAHGTCHPMGESNGKHVDAVVSGGMGARAVQKLNEAGIKTYRAEEGTVRTTIRSFKQQKLEEMIPANSFVRHGCHGQTVLEEKA
jgi:predicted Fe-Mo cluster-binding NifX family protein